MGIAEQYEGTKLCLCEERSDRLWVSVDAEFFDKKLTVLGQDLGEPCEQFWGSYEYEYWYCFDEEGTEALLESLAQNGKDPVEEFGNCFSGLNACRNLRNYCEKEKIPFEFSNWSSVS